ncbi:MAG TPA: acyltransferase family protein [Mycobacteriales bacterium]|nr:acyltransferase family protein [Mycobacteriales bacterium]
MRTPARARDASREPALDGIRGLAAGSVLLLHTRVPFARGGFYAVDVFFALSGFLITRLLLRERARHGRIDVPRFWARRTTRLWPPLAALLLLGIPFADLLSPGHSGASYAREAITAGTWSMNIATALTPSVDPPLGHTWSLAAEEQYYLVWPLLLLLAIAVGATMRRLAATCCGLAVASWLVMVLDWHGTTFLPAVYTRPDARAFDLLTGSALALALGSTRPPRSLVAVAQPRATGLLSLAFIVAAVIVPSYLRPDLWLDLTVGAPLVSIATCLLIVHLTLRPATPAARLLGSWPGRVSGTISYSLYLVHQPVLTVVYAHDHGTLPRHGAALPLTEIAIAVAAAVVLWVTVERPAHQLSRRITPQPRAAADTGTARPRRNALRPAVVTTLGFVPLAFVLGGTAAAAQWTGPPVVGDPKHAPSSPWPGTTGAPTGPGAAPASRAPAPTRRAPVGPTGTHPSAAPGGPTATSPAPDRRSAPPGGRPPVPVTVPSAPLPAVPSVPSVPAPSVPSVPIPTAPVPTVPVPTPPGL